MPCVFSRPDAVNDLQSQIFHLLIASHYRRFFSLDFEYKTYTVEVPSPPLVNPFVGLF